MIESITSRKSVMNDLSVRLLPATIADYPTIQNMARFYVYDRLTVASEWYVGDIA